VVNIQDRLVRLDWKAMEASLWQRGYAKTDPLLTAKECDSLIALYGNDQLFRSRIDMKRFRFGEGEYKYFTYPLPPLVQTLREHIYPRLAVIANAWVSGICFRRITLNCSLFVVARDRPSPHHCYFVTPPGIITAFIRIFMERSRSHCSSPPSSVVLTAIFPVVNFCSWNSDRGHNHAVKSWLLSREKSSSLRRGTVPYKEAEDITESTCGTA